METQFINYDAFDDIMPKLRGLLSAAQHSDTEILFKKGTRRQTLMDRLSSYPNLPADERADIQRVIDLLHMSAKDRKNIVIIGTLPFCKTSRSRVEGRISCRTHCKTLSFLKEKSFKYWKVCGSCQFEGLLKVLFPSNARCNGDTDCFQRKEKLSI